MIYVVGHVSQMDKVMYVGWCFSWIDGALGPLFTGSTYHERIAVVKKSKC